MDRKETSVSASISLESIGIITFIVFLILKLTGTWNINWFWVWFPLWLPAAITVAIYLIIFLVLFIVYFVNRRK